MLNRGARKILGLGILKGYMVLIAVQWDIMFAQQSGVCGICKQPETAEFGGNIKFLAVDHSHISGNVRGLLCQRCNHVLGFVSDDISLLSRMIQYLGEH